MLNIRAIVELVPKSSFTDSLASVRRQMRLDTETIARLDFTVSELPKQSHR
jgi:hypothetical protein